MASDALKEIAVLLGLKNMKHADGSRVVVTPHTVVKKVTEVVAELEKLKQSTTEKRKRDDDVSTPAKKVCPPTPATPYTEPKVNSVKTSIYWGKCKDDVRYIPLNGGFHWDDRLSHALNSDKVNRIFADTFSFAFEEIGLRGGEVFTRPGGIEWQVVGRQPTRPIYGLVAVRRSILSDRSRVLVPNDLRMFNKKVVMPTI